MANEPAFDGFDSTDIPRLSKDIRIPEPPPTPSTPLTPQRIHLRQHKFYDPNTGIHDDTVELITLEEDMRLVWFSLTAQIDTNGNGTYWRFTIDASSEEGTAWKPTFYLNDPGGTLYPSHTMWSPMSMIFKKGTTFELQITGDDNEARCTAEVILEKL